MHVWEKYGLQIWREDRQRIMAVNECHGLLFRIGRLFVDSILEIVNVRVKVDQVAYQEKLSEFCVQNL